MIDLTNNDQANICLDCAIEFGNHYINCSPTSFGKCDWCGERTEVADAGLFFYQSQQKIENETQ